MRYFLPHLFQDLDIAALVAFHHTDYYCALMNPNPISAGQAFSVLAKFIAHAETARRCGPSVIAHSSLLPMSPAQLSYARGTLLEVKATTLLRMNL